jgi:hypothetical protein
MSMKVLLSQFKKKLSAKNAENTEKLVNTAEISFSLELKKLMLLQI